MKELKQRLSIQIAEKPPPTIEDIDILRHREITSKAVSAILILTLKWFKASRPSFPHHK
jgi:hypothetical protein